MVSIAKSNWVILLYGWDVNQSCTTPAFCQITSSLQFANTHEHSWWRDAPSNSHLSQQHYTVTPTELKPGSLDPQSDRTTTRATMTDLFISSWKCAWPGLPQKVMLYLFSNTWIVSCRCSFFDCSLLFTISNIVQALFKSLRSFSIFSYEASSFLRFCKNRVEKLYQRFK